MSLEENFKAAADKVKNLKAKPTDEELLDIYGLFKQATVGDNETSQPWAVQLKERAKWDAWTKRKGLSKEDAQKTYVETADKLVTKYGLA